MKHKIIYALTALLCLGGLAACSDDPIVDNPSGETYIYWLRIANAGLTGTEAVQGVVDEATKTVTFDVPAETNIEAIKFTSKLSLNAHLDKDVYDLSSLSGPVTVVNVDNQSTYTIKLNLIATTDRPMIERVGVRLPDGTEHNGYISMIDSTIYLGAEEFEQVEITEVVTLPHRATLTYENVTDRVVKREPKGSVTVEFMGKTKEYRFSFSAIPVFGADFNRPTVYNYAADGGNQWADFVGENTRSADFDGNELLIVSREGGINPRILTVSEVMSGSPAGKVLNMDGVTGGTFLLSAGRLSHGHIYITNLSTNVSADQPLRIYHWANSSAVCENILSVDGMGETPFDELLKGGRYGDNISINLDDNGNGYIYMIRQDGTSPVRFTVTGWTTLSEPTLVTMPTTAPYYASVNEVDGSPGEYVYTSVQTPIFLIDKDGNQIGNSIPAEIVPLRCTDARVVVYDNERYLICTSARWGSWSGDPSATLYVYSLADGINTAQAFDKLINAEDPSPLFELELGGAFGSAPSASTGWGVVNGEFGVMGAATKAGFVLVTFPERE